MEATTVTRLEVVHSGTDRLDHAGTLVATDDREPPGGTEPGCSSDRHRPV